MLENLFRPMHLLLILIIVMVIWGPGKLPQLGSGLGDAIKNFKKSMADGKEEGKSVATTAAPETKEKA
jgi:sec-independent protein translocase protein TatA